MGKGGVVLGLIGILIGAGGLGFGFFNWIMLQTNAENNETWYKSDNTTFAVSPAATVLELTNLTISFELTSTASVYMSFSCVAEIFPLGGTSTIFFFYKVDGVVLTNPTAVVGNVNAGSLRGYFSVNLQHYIENMSPGMHNVTPQVSSGTDINLISEMSLFVQSSM